MNGWAVVIWTVVLIAMSSFFVGVEFALMSAKRHRLEEAAQRSVAGRAALKNASELTLLLAGSQLGITVCTLALGAITKPAVHHALMPVLTGLGLAPVVADGAAFLLALLIVTFLHLVVGEMAPKSWAISHPEKSAVWLSLPMRGFMLLTRPILVVLNRSANWLVHKSGSAAVDELSAGQNPESLRHLVEHSVSVGALEAGYSATLSSALDLRTLTVADIAIRGDITAVSPDADISEIQRVSVESAHRRVVVRDGDVTLGLVHVRDTLVDGAAGRKAADLVRAPLLIPSTMPAAQAMRQMRDTRNQLAIVTDGGQEVGLLSLDDIMQRMLPQKPRPAAPQTIAITKGAHPHPRT